MHRLAAFVVTVVLVLQTTGCGLLLFPERQGQKSGRIDPGVAILDAAGLIVFIVPGLIAFGVDFITGCRHLVAPSGVLAAMKGVFPREELAQVPADCDCREVRRLKVPMLDAERHLVLCRIGS